MGVILYGLKFNQGKKIGTTSYALIINKLSLKTSCNGISHREIDILILF